jgi:hypothetical protein
MIFKGNDCAQAPYKGLWALGVVFEFHSLLRQLILSVNDISQQLHSFGVGNLCSQKRELQEKKDQRRYRLGLGKGLEILFPTLFLQLGCQSTALWEYCLPSPSSGKSPDACFTTGLYSKYCALTQFNQSATF